jgi:hypothetical protein
VQEGTGDLANFLLESFDQRSFLGGLFDTHQLAQHVPQVAAFQEINTKFSLAEQRKQFIESYKPLVVSVSEETLRSQTLLNELLLDCSDQNEHRAPLFDFTLVSEKNS